VAYKLTEPANLGSLLATLWQMHPDIAQAITAAMNFRAYAAMDAQRVEEGKLVKL
jgi:predicted ATPase